MTVTSEPSRLRVWPQGIVLPDADILLGGSYRFWGADSNDPLVIATEGGIGTICLPEEFYLRELADLNIDDDHAIIGLVSAFGVPWLPVERDEDTVALRRAVLAEIRKGANPEDWQEPDVIPNIMDEVPAITAVLSSVDAHCPSLQECRLSLRLLRDLTRIVQADAGALPFDAVISRWESPLTFSRPRDLDWACVFASSWIQAGLVRLHPTISHQEAYRPGQPDALVDLYEAVCVQLFNAISLGSGFRECGNRACQRLFSHQRSAGGSRPGRWGEDASGLKYCSPECAQAEAARVRRDNIRSALRLHDEGMSTSAIAERMDASHEKAGGWVAAGLKRRKTKEEK